jgi:hypothetical protein
MRNAIWGSGTPTKSSGMITDQVLQEDGSTPVTSGHKSMADMLVYNTQRTAEDLMLLPYGDYDTQSIAMQVPDKAVYGGERLLGRSLALHCCMQQQLPLWDFR